MIFNLFRKKSKKPEEKKITNVIRIKNSWESITYDDFIQIHQIAEADIPETYKTVSLLSVLSGMDEKDIESLPINIFTKMVKALEFMDTKPPKPMHKKEYIINERKYVVKADITRITTAQFIDYNSYASEENPDPINLLSLWLIPEGHEYNDGYDIEQVKYDIRSMNFLDAQAVAFFLQRQSALFAATINAYSEKNLKELKMKKEDREKLLRPLRSMALSLWSCESVNSQTPLLTQLWDGQSVKSSI